MSNPKRRESDGSLIADLRRRVSWLEQRRTPAGAKKLDDLSDVAASADTAVGSGMSVPAATVICA